MLSQFRFSDIRRHWLFHLAAFVGALTSICQVHGQGLSKESTDLLLTVSNANRSNIERIRTWRGEIHITQSAAFRRTPEQKANPLLIDSEHVVEFVCDQVRDSTRANSLCRKFTTKGPREVVASTKKQSSKNAEMHSIATSSPCANVMVHNGVYYRYTYDAGRDFLMPARSTHPLPVQRVVTLVSASEKRATRPLSSEIDPFYWFTWKGKQVNEVFGTYHSLSNEKRDLNHLLVSRDGDKVTLTVAQGVSYNKYIVSLSQGACLVEVQASDGPGSDQGTWSYENENVSGVWVPKRVSFTMDSEDGAHVERTLSWTRNVVNEPVESAEFTLLKLGLRRGDEVQDKRTGQRYLVQGPEYPAPSSTIKEAAVKPRANVRVLVLVASAILIAAVVAGMVLSRRLEIGRQ
jgi:hypothetical protein